MYMTHIPYRLQPNESTFFSTRRAFFSGWPVTLSYLRLTFLLRLPYLTLTLTCIPHLTLPWNLPFHTQKLPLPHLTLKLKPYLTLSYLTSKLPLICKLLLCSEFWELSDWKQLWALHLHITTTTTSDLWAYNTLQAPPFLVSNKKCLFPKNKTVSTLEILKPPNSTHLKVPNERCICILPH